MSGDEYHDYEPDEREESDEFGRFWPWSKDMRVSRALVWWLIQHLFLPVARQEERFRDWWRFGDSPLRLWQRIRWLWSHQKGNQ